MQPSLSIHAICLVNSSTDVTINTKTVDDMAVFIITCENIIIPLNDAISNIPGDDKDVTENIAKSYLDIQGEQGLAIVINV